jgi:hypothetical protein
LSGTGSSVRPYATTVNFWEIIDMNARAAGFLAIVVLAGCESRSAPADVTPPGISYRLSGSDMSAANRQADAYCQQYGKRATLDKVSPTGNDNVASYECR